MAVPTNTYVSADSVGNRESLDDVMNMIAVTDTPFYTMCKKGTASAVYEEWLTDALDDPVATNYHSSGDDSTAEAITAPSRYGNYCQIAKKVFSISRTQEKINKAGRKSEIAYQTMRHLKMLKNDMEMSLVSATAKSGSEPRKLGGLEAWYQTNVSRGSGGASGTSGAVTAPTDGAQRAFTETLLKNMLQTVYQSGGDPSVIMLGAYNRRVLSGFDGFEGSATLQVNTESDTRMGSVRVYKSDWGTLTIMPNRKLTPTGRGRSAHILDPSMWEVATLDPVTREQLAKTGDSTKYHIVTEFTLKALNEKSSGLIADLTTSAS